MIIDYYWLGERPLRRRLPDREMSFALSCRLANGSGQQEVQGVSLAVENICNQASQVSCAS